MFAVDAVEVLKSIYLIAMIILLKQFNAKNYFSEELREKEKNVNTPYRGQTLIKLFSWWFISRMRGKVCRAR